MRYAQLLRAVAEKQPATILEVGTWCGARALEMLTLAPKGCKYYGFDLFEDATAETDAREMNVKPHCSVADVQERLEGFDVQLFKGDSRETLGNFTERVDFVWLDGGHSVETIAADWSNVRRCLNPEAWVFLDDYYTGPIDTSAFGCNLLLITAGLMHDILPVKDEVKGGGFVQMVRVFPEG